MSITSFDPAGRLHLTFRRERDGSKVFVFKNSSDEDYDISALDFELRIKKKSSSSANVLLLTVGDGLEISGNELTVIVDETDTNLPADFYWWELFNITTDETWIYGNVYVVTDSDNPVDTLSVTINLESETINLTIENSVSSGSVETQYRGTFDPSGNLLPSTGGSASNGDIVGGDEWILTASATFAGLIYPPDTIVKAKIDSPGQTIQNWRFI